MNTDKLLKEAFASKSKDIHIPEENFDEMLNCIEDKIAKIEENRSNRFAYVFSNFIARIHFKDLLEVSVFLVILIFMPLWINQSKEAKESRNQHIEQVNPNITSGTGAFTDIIEKNIEDNHSSNPVTIGNLTEFLKDEVYTDMNVIKEKLPFEIEYPGFVPEGYELNKTDLVVRRNKAKDGSITENPNLEITYKNKEGKILQINQFENTGYKLLGYEYSWTTEGWEPASLNGLDAAISDKQSTGSLHSQLTFSSKNISYIVTVIGGIDRETLIKIGESFKCIKEPESWPTEKQYRYTNINDFKTMLPFTVEFPKFYPDNLTFASSSLAVNKAPKGTLYQVNLTYSSPQKGNALTSDGLTIKIMSEPSIPVDILKKCSKVNLGNLDCFLYPAENGVGMNQIMFIKNNLLYNLSSYNLNMEDLKKIAESFSDSYKREISKEYIDLKASISTDIPAMAQTDNVLMVTRYVDLKNKKDEIYNIDKLDQFLSAYKNRKAAKVRIIKYIEKDNRVWIDELMDIQFDGKKLESITYDVTTYKDAYIPAPALTYAAIDKWEHDNYSRYMFFMTADTHNGQSKDILFFHNSGLK